MLNEPNATFKGHAAIANAVASLLASLPRDFVFTADGPAMGHHGIGRLQWRAGPPGGPTAVTGMDIAHFQGHLIHSLTILLDPSRA